MHDDDFGTLDRAWAGGADDGFRALAAKFLAERNYPALFEVRLMAARVGLGLPAIGGAPPDDLPAETRRAYEQAQIAAARETGELFLRDGKIYRAWPYFRAIGEPGPVREALEAARPDPEAVDGLVEIAFHEAVHPRRGFELILEHYGTCRAITNFHHYPAPEGREESALLLARTVHGELLANLRRAIERAEGAAPESADIAAIVRERDWLFEGNAYYLDTSHVSSVVQASLEFESPEILRMALEMAEYGRRLGPMYRFKGDAPFEDVFEDCAIYLRALLGEAQDEAVAHFRAKLDPEPDPFGDAPAQALVRLLVRLGRFGEAVDVAAERLADVDPARLNCPGVYELCRMAGDPARMAAIARARGDLIGYAAALAEGAR